MSDTQLYFVSFDTNAGYLQRDKGDALTADNMTDGDYGTAQYWFFVDASDEEEAIRKALEVYDS